MLERTTHRLAGFDVESDASIVVKGYGSEGGLVPCQQTHGLLPTRRREEFAILNGDVELNSLFAFVLAYVGLQYLGVNFGWWHCTCLLEQLSDLAILVIL